MKFLKLLFVVAALVLVCGSPKPSEAGFSFSYYGPGIGIYSGHHSYYSPYHYSPYYSYGYEPRYYTYRHVRPYRYASPYRYERSRRYDQSYHRYAGSCSRWSERCGANWGFDNDDYHGCLKYHGCE